MLSGNQVLKRMFGSLYTIDIKKKYFKQQLKERKLYKIGHIISDNGKERFGILENTNKQVEPRNLRTQQEIDKHVRERRQLKKQKASKSEKPDIKN